MSERFRDALAFLPDGFVETYVAALGKTPPVELLEAYEELVWRLYTVGPSGTGGKGGTRRARGFKNPWPFRDVGLLRVKDEVDTHLRATAAALSRWSRTGARESRTRDANPRGDARLADGTEGIA